MTSLTGSSLNQVNIESSNFEKPISMKKLFLIAWMALASTLIFSCETKVRYGDKGETYYDQATDILYDTKSGKPLTGIYIGGPYSWGDEMIIEYKDGKAHGKMICKYPNGYYYTRHYFNNQECSPAKYYDPQGNEISKDKFREQTECYRNN